MPGTYFERTGSRSASNTTVKRKYYGQNVPDEADLLTFIGTLPATISGLPYTEWDAQEVEGYEGDYEITVTWGQGDKGEQDQAGTSGYKFSFQAPGLHIMQSLATINVYYDAALLPFGAGDFGGAINVVNDGGKMRVEGYNLQPPAEVFTLPYTDVDTVITASYQATVANLCGKVNSTTFRTKNAGEVMLVRAQGENKSGLWNLEFGFAYVQNTTGDVLGNITGIAKDGMDLIWPFYQAVKDNTAKCVVKQPAAVFVERVWRRADLNALALP